MAQDLITPALQFVVAGVLTALADAGREVGRVIPIAAGTTPAWDECCDGLLYSTIVEITPGVDSTTQGAASVRCGVHFWIVTASITVVRCVETVDDGGNFPTAETMSAEGEGMLTDAIVVQQALYCTDGIRGIVRGQPTQEDGACVGFSWTFTMRVGVCPCGE